MMEAFLSYATREYLNVQRPPITVVETARFLKDADRLMSEPGSGASGGVHRRQS
jgi:hypothetical protein